MEEENLENTDLTNGENEENLGSENQDDSSEDVNTLKAKNQSLYEQLQKAKGKVRDSEGNWIKKPEIKTESITKTNGKSDDFDYGEKAFLTANGIKGSKEFDFVKSELKSSGQDLDSLLENDYFQTKLEKFRALNKTAEAIPTGKRSGGVSVDSVEYWSTKPIEEVPKEMRIKVVNAKLEKETKKGVFYNS